MLVPRFTIRSALIGITLCAVVFLIVGFGFRGENAAWAFTIGLLSVVLTAVVHAVWFAVAWMFAQLTATQTAIPAWPATRGGPVGQPITDAPNASPETRGEANG